jgi:hypothetical protein
MIFESQMRPYVVYICGAGCGYVERSMVWDSSPLGHDGQLRCPDCGSQAWDYPRLTKREAIETVDQGISRVERFHRL